MNKNTTYLVLILLVLVLFSGVINEVTGLAVFPKCNDPDGKDRDSGISRSTCIKRTGTGTGTWCDRCADAKTVSEVRCKSKYQRERKNIACAEGYECKDGACVVKQVTCTDTDGGKDYYVKGALNYGHEDYCMDSTTLKEYFCDSPSVDGYNTEFYVCPNGCSDGACISAVPTTPEYVNMYIEYVQSPGLDESGYPGITPATTATKLSSPAAIFDVNGKNTNTLWVTGTNEIFYRDVNANPQVQYYNISLAGIKIEYKNTLLALHSKSTMGIEIMVPGYNEELTVRFFSDGNIRSLGEIISLPEADELVWRDLLTTSALHIGTQSTDFTMKYGTIIKSPNVNGASDQVILEIPDFNPRYYYKFVGKSITIDSKIVTLLNVGSNGSVLVDVDGTVAVIPPSGTEKVNGVMITNIAAFYKDIKEERSAMLQITLA